MASDPNRHLLFGILALQMDFVSREQLVAATSLWLLNKAKPIEEILLDQHALREEDCHLLAPLVARHIENHDGDAEKSLAAISSIGSFREDLQSLGDPQIEATLSLISSDRDHPQFAKSVDPSAQQGVQTLTVGSQTSGGSRFRIIRPYARGGLGEVSVAQDTELNREVALKEIQTKFADDEDSRARFLLEAEVTGSLEHPGIVPIYGLGRYADGRPFYAMRFIKGDSLKEAVDRFHAASRGLAVEHRIALDSVEFRKLMGRFIDVCDAIEYAHSRGVLHRDLKPGNIMLGKYGETLVVDWGLAKALGHRAGEEQSAETTFRPLTGDGSAATQMGSRVGTPSYMSPEQAEGRLDQLGPKSDVYSLGATLYYVLTGNSPCSGKDLAETLRQVIEGQFVRPRERKPDVPPALDAICLKAMARAPEDRYQSPRALADDLQRWLADEPVEAHREPLISRAGRWIRHHKTVAVALATALLVLLTTATFFIARQVQHANSVKEQVAVLVNEGRNENREGNIDGAIRMLAVAAGLGRSSNGQADSLSDVEKQLRELTRYRDFQRQADETLAGGIHGMNVQATPDPIVEQCTRVLALFNVEEDPNWHSVLSESIVEAEQIARAREAAARLMIMKAVRISLFDTKGESGREAARAALRLLDQAADLKPPTFGIWMCRMLFHRRVEEDDLADQAGERMTQLAKSGAPRTALDYYLLGSITLHILKQPESAVDMYEQSLSAEPDYFGAALGLYFAHEARGNAQDKLSALNRCLAIHPHDTQLYFFRGVTLLELRRYELAIRDLDRHAKEKPEFGQVHYWRGRCFFMLERWHEADAAFTRAFELDKNLLNRLSWRALARAKLPEQFAHAAKDATDALALEDASDDDAWRCARVFALCSASALQAGLDERAESYAARSIELLRQSLRKRAIKPVQLGSDDLAALRERDDFRHLRLEFTP